MDISTSPGHHEAGNPPHLLHQKEKRGRITSAKALAARYRKRQNLPSQRALLNLSPMKTLKNHDSFLRFLAMNDFLLPTQRPLLSAHKSLQDSVRCIWGTLEDHLHAQIGCFSYLSKVELWKRFSPWEVSFAFQWQGPVCWIDRGLEVFLSELRIECCRLLTM